MLKLLNILLTISLFAFLLSGFFHPITSMTQDLGRHLATGEIILNNFNVPKTNLFSYTYPNFPFINTHWFSEVIFYLIFKLFSFNGLIFLTVLTIFVSFFLFFKIALKKSNLTVISIVSIIYFRILFERTDIRPEIFSFLFLSIFITILYSYRKKFTRWIFVLPFLELFWVNTHIYFPIGIAVLGLFFIDEIISHRKEILSRFLDKKIPKHFSVLFIILCFSSLITIINPNTLNGALYPLRVFENYGYTIEENQNIFLLESLFAKPTIPYLKIGILILFISLLLNIKKSKPIDWLLSIFFSFLAVTAVRNFPLFVFGTFVAATSSLSSLSDRLEFFRKSIILKNALYFILIGIIFISIINITSLKPLGLGVEKGAENAANFYLSNKLKGPLFNNFDIGSYLDYRFFKHEKVFVDGRPEAYPVSFFQKIYIPMQDTQYAFEKFDRTYNFNTIFFSHTDQTPWAINFLKEIVKNNNWRIIYLDDYVIILIKNIPANKNFVKQYEINETSFSLENFKSDMNSLKKLAVFLNKIGWKQSEQKTYDYMLSLDPDFCPALYNKLNFLDQNSAIFQIYLNRYNNKCK